MNDKPSDWNKWMVIFNNNHDAPEYLSESQHDLFLQALEERRSQVILKDGRVLPTYSRVVANPEWYDPEQLAKLRRAIQARERILAEKRDKELFDD